MAFSTNIFRSLALAAVVSSSAMACAPQEDAADVVGSEDDLATRRASRHPIVLVHGFTGSASTSIWSFYEVPEALEADGHTVQVAQVAPFKPVSERAKNLAGDVDEAQAKCRERRGCDASKVHIIAHSMGGLDARYLVSKLGYGDRVASITTISTAHRGTAIADVALKFIRDDGALDKVLNALTSWYGRSFTERDLADDPRVTYLSWAGVSNVAGIPNFRDDEACEGKFDPVNGRDRMNALLVPVASVVAHGLRLRPNDGMATVESSKWGRFKGCIPADHLDEVGQPKHEGPNVHGGFDHIVFYRDIASSLDAEVAAATSEEARD